MCRKIICLLYVLSFSQALSAQDAVPPAVEQTLTELSLNIQSRLNEAKQHSASLLTSLTEVQRDLNLSQQQRDYYPETSMQLSSYLANTIDSLENLSIELNQSKLDLAVEKDRVKTRNKVLLLLGIIGVIAILSKAAAFILYAKRVPVPRWLDILL
jgi:hypothetical protein